jgi:hypothetical protein
MLQDHRAVADNSLMTVINMIMSCFGRLQGKSMSDYVDAPTEELTSKQPQYGMPNNFYDNQSIYAIANKAKLAFFGDRNRRPI